MSSFHIPDLVATREFTRVVGKSASIIGFIVFVAGMVHVVTDSPLTFWLIAPGGLLMVLFGLAAYQNTETLLGNIIRLLVVAVFVAGGAYALWQWSLLIWGPRTATVSGDVTLLGFYLMAGPALLVPAGLIIARPGWVPLVVTPALAAISSAGVLALVVVFIQSFVAADESLSLLDQLALLLAIGCLTYFVVFSAVKGLSVVKTKE